MKRFVKEWRVSLVFSAGSELSLYPGGAGPDQVHLYEGTEHFRCVPVQSARGDH